MLLGTRRELYRLKIFVKNILVQKNILLQVVPVWPGEQGAGGDTKVDKEKEKRELSHECVLRNLAHGRETVVSGLGRKSGSSRTRGSSIPVHRLGEDARPLTGDEYRLYSGLIRSEYF